MIAYTFTVKLGYDNVANLFPFSKFHFIFLIIFHILSKKTRKTALSKSLLYAFIFESNMHEGLIFLALSSIKHSKSFSPKEILLDTTTSLISTLSIETGFLCW